MEHCEITHKVRTFECDSHDNMKADCIMKYMQESATNQMTEEGLPYDTLLERGTALLINRMDMEFIKPIKKFDCITLASWPCEGRGATLPRKYTVHRDGELVAKALGQWSLVDVETKKILRASAVDFGTFTIEEGCKESCERFKTPEKEDMEKVGTIKVGYNQVDCNGHLNNTNYLMMVQDFIPELREGGHMKSAKVHFSKEALLGMTIDIYSLKEKTEEGFVYLFKGILVENQMLNSEIKVEVTK